MSKSAYSSSCMCMKLWNGVEVGMVSSSLFGSLVNVVWMDESYLSFGSVVIDHCWWNREKRNLCCQMSLVCGCSDCQVSDKVNFQSEKCHFIVWMFWRNETCEKLVQYLLHWLWGERITQSVLKFTSPIRVSVSKYLGRYSICLCA